MRQGNNSIALKDAERRRVYLQSQVESISSVGLKLYYSTVDQINVSIS